MVPPKNFESLSVVQKKSSVKINTLHFSTLAKGGEPLAELMHKSWVSFIKTGNPNFKGLPKWDLYSRDKMNSMIFDEYTKSLQLDPVFDDKTFPANALIYKK
jgi:carboxylesterase type B